MDVTGSVTALSSEFLKFTHLGALSSPSPACCTKTPTRGSEPDSESLFSGDPPSRGKFPRSVAGPSKSKRRQSAERGKPLRNNGVTAACHRGNPD